MLFRRSVAYLSPMLDIDSASQRQGMQELIISDLVGVLEEAPPAQGPADLERFAGILSVAVEHPGVPAEVGSALVDALAHQRGANAAGVLTALSLLPRRGLLPPEAEMTPTLSVGPARLRSPSAIRRRRARARAR
jgi:hypothetical protein